MFSLDKTCLLCHHNRWRLIHTFASYTVVRCMHCSLLRLHPQPSHKETEKLYDATYFEYNLEKQLPDEKADIESEIFKRAHFLSWLHYTLKKNSGRLLEVGCASGFLLKAFERHGWHVTGIEISATAARYAREKLGLKVMTGEIEETHIGDESYDVILLLHTLEHLPNPVSALIELAKHMKQDSRLIIQVPNAASLEARLQGKNWQGWRIPYHLYHFSPKTLRLLINKCGLEIIRWEFSLPAFETKFLKKRNAGKTAGQSMTVPSSYSFSYRLRKTLLRLNKSLPIGRDMTVIAKLL